MTAFVEECREEWRRLGVPDFLADEMATDLEADLAEAEAEGVSTAEIVGESDPRHFAATWAGERGLVSEPAPQKKRRHVWPWVVVAFVLLALFLSWLALQSFGTGHASSAPAQAANPVKVPRLVGLKACDAVRIGHLAGLGMIHTVYRGRCDALVVSQKPAAGTYVALHTPTTLRLSLVRVPHLVGLNVCKAKLVGARSGIWIRKRSPDDATTRGLPASSMCKNFVLAQTPAAGRIVRAPVFVTVRVSRARS